MNDKFDAAGVTGGDDAANDQVMSELRVLAAVTDPVPPEAVAAARSAIAWRTLDAELAELTADAADVALAGLRGVGTPTLLTFEAASLTVEIEVMEDGDRRRLFGQLVPPGPGAVQVRHGGGTIEVRADDMGRFSAGAVTPGPVSLRCHAATGVVETDWFLA
jgi:hypothetical protein